MKINNSWLLIIGALLFLASYSFDNAIDLFFKDLQPSLLDIVLSLITNFGIVVLVMVVIPSIILYKKGKKSVYLLWATFFLSFVLAFVLKLIFLRQRPIDSFTFPFTSIINYSFPSMHAMTAFSLLPALIEFLPKQKFFWVSFAFLVVFSRIYFGFHFLSDVVFGGFLGYFIGSLLLRMHEKGKLWT